MVIRVAFVLAAFSCFAFSGCSASPKVPTDATLVYHGPAFGENSFATPKGAGTFYWVDYKRGEVVAAIYWTPGGTARFDRVPIEGQEISVYFSAEPAAGN